MPQMRLTTDPGEHVADVRARSGILVVTWSRSGAFLIRQGALIQ